MNADRSVIEEKQRKKMAEKPKIESKSEHKNPMKRKSAKPDSGLVEEDEGWREQFECPVCLEEMKPPARIHQCVDGHLLCGMCRENPAITSCPVCRGNIMGRAVVMEKLARALFGKNNLCV